MLFKYFWQDLCFLGFSANPILYTIYLQVFIIPRPIFIKVPCASNIKSRVIIIKKLNRNRHRATGICISIESPR